MKIHEYQAKAILAKYDVPVPRGEVAFTVDEVEECGEEDRRQRSGEGADSCGRARERRRGEGGEGCRRGAGDRQEDAGDETGDAPDRPGGPHCSTLAGGGDAAHRAGALSWNRARPRAMETSFHGVGGGRNGNRRSSREDAGINPEGNAGTGLWTGRFSRPQSGFWHGHPRRPA
jgi:hypothetical protein